MAAAPNLVKTPLTTFVVHPHELGNPETSIASGKESLARLSRAAATLKAGSSMPLLEFDPEVANYPSLEADPNAAAEIARLNEANSELQQEVQNQSNQLSYCTNVLEYVMHNN